MKQTVIAIFAHPDDECFGPGGTLALFAKKYDLYVIFVSKGEAGELDEAIKTTDLGSHRQQETESSAHVLGIKDTFFLNFPDGLMCNNMYHDIVQAVEKILIDKKPYILMTFEPRGFSGHLDHVLVSSVTTFLYEKYAFIQKLYYFCIDEIQRKAIPQYFIHFPPGYKRNQIDEIINVSSVWEQKIQAIHSHQSQKDDIAFYQPMLAASNKKENFIVLEK